MPRHNHHKTALCGPNCPAYEGTDSPVQPAQSAGTAYACGVRVWVPVTVLALLAEGFGVAGDGGMDPFYQTERAIVEEWIEGMNLDATLAAARERQIKEMFPNGRH